MAKTIGKPKDEMTPEQRSEEMRRRVMCRWIKADPNRTKPTKEAIELVRHACSMGATVGRIVEVLDISERKFYRWLNDSPEFAAAVKAGKQIEHDALCNKLIELALKGNVAALCMALKSRHNYNDSGSGTAVIENKVAITFQLPDSMKPEQYLKTLTATAEIIKPGDAARVLEHPGDKRAVLKQLAAEVKDVKD